MPARNGSGFKSYGFASKARWRRSSAWRLPEPPSPCRWRFSRKRDRFVLVAVLSLRPGRNMLVAPDGRWLGAYVPAYLRAYPFRLLPQQGTDQTRAVHRYRQRAGGRGRCCRRGFRWARRQYLAGPEKALDFLNELERSRRATDVAVSALAEAGIIQPWPIKLKAGHGDQPFTGLYRVDEAALNALADDAFLKLRKASGDCQSPTRNCYRWANLVFSSILRGRRRNCDRHRFRHCLRASTASLSCRAAIQSSFDKSWLCENASQKR